MPKETSPKPVLAIAIPLRDLDIGDIPPDSIIPHPSHPIVIPPEGGTPPINWDAVVSHPIEEPPTDPVAPGCFWAQVFNPIKGQWTWCKVCMTISQPR